MTYGWAVNQDDHILDSVDATRISASIGEEPFVAVGRNLGEALAVAGRAAVVDQV